MQIIACPAGQQSDVSSPSRLLAAIFVELIRRVSALLFRVSPQNLHSRSRRKKKFLLLFLGGYPPRDAAISGRQMPSAPGRTHAPSSRLNRPGRRAARSALSGPASVRLRPPRDALPPTALTTVRPESQSFYGHENRPPSGQLLIHAWCSRSRPATPLPDYDRPSKSKDYVVTRRRMRFDCGHRCQITRINRPGAHRKPPTWQPVQPA